MVGSFFLIEKVERDAPKITLRGIGNVATDRTLLFVSLLAILSQVLIFATVFGFTPVYAIQLGADKFSLSLLSLFANVPVALASLFGGRRWSVRYGEKRMVVAGFLLMGIFTFTVPFTHHLWVLMVTQALAGFGRGLSFTLLMGMSIKHMPADKRATAMGFFQAIYGLGMFIGPVLMGIIGDYFSLNEGFIVLGVLGACSALLAYLFVQNATKKQPLAANSSTIVQ